MEWIEFKDIVLGFMATGACGFIVYEIHELRKSVESLNEKIATVLERTASHELRILRLEDQN